MERQEHLSTTVRDDVRSATHTAAESHRSRSSSRTGRCHAPLPVCWDDRITWVIVTRLVEPLFSSVGVEGCSTSDVAAMSLMTRVASGLSTPARRSVRMKAHRPEPLNCRAGAGGRARRTRRCTPPFPQPTSAVRGCARRRRRCIPDRGASARSARIAWRPWSRGDVGEHVSSCGGCTKQLAVHTPPYGLVVRQGIGAGSKRACHGARSAGALSGSTSLWVAGRG